LDTIKKYLSELRGNKRKRRLISIAAALVVLLVVCTCISIHMRANIHSEYTSAAAHIELQIHQGLQEMVQTFSRIDDPAVDVQHKLIPSLKAQYSAVRALNDSLMIGFDADAAVLSPKLIEAFDAAFESYAECYRQGTPTGLAQDDMNNCMVEVAAMVEAYFPKEEELPELNPNA